MLFKDELRRENDGLSGDTSILSSVGDIADSTVIFSMADGDLASSIGLKAGDLSGVPRTTGSFAGSSATKSAASSSAGGGSRAEGIRDIPPLCVATALGEDCILLNPDGSK